MKEILSFYFKATIFFLLSHNSLLAQPQLTLWQIDQNHFEHHSSDAVDDGDEHREADESLFYECGSNYYIVRKGDATEAISYWSIRNDGETELNLTLPLTLSGALDRFEILTQPTSLNLAPGEETAFSLRYFGPENDLTATLEIRSNSVENPTCTLILNGGVGCEVIFEKVWIGGGDGNTWEDGDNWSPSGTPTANDDVLINYSGSISMSSNPTIQSLYLRVEAALTIDETSLLTIEGMPTCNTTNGINMENVSQIVNNGEIIMNVDFPHADGIELEDTAILVNNGEIILNDPGSDGIKLNNESIVENHGELTIIKPSSDGIDICDASSMINEKRIILIDVSNDGIEMSEQSSLINYDSITIDSSTFEGIDMTDESELVNNGDITVKDSGGDGIEMDIQATIHNHGEFSLHSIGSEGIDMKNESEIFNHGTIEVEGYEADGFDFKDDARFENLGIITIDGMNSNPNDGLEIENNSIFINHQGGIINLSNIEQEILDVQSPTSIFINNGIINIFSTLLNEDAIQIDGKFDNSGIISITGPLDNTYTAIFIRGAGELNNLRCGIINIENGILRIESGAFENNSIFTSGNPDDNENNGILINNDQIITTTGMFNVSPNPITGSGEIIAGAIPILVAPACVEIPTMGQWGIVVLGLLILLFSVLIQNQREFIFPK